MRWPRSFALAVLLCAIQRTPAVADPTPSVQRPARQVELGLATGVGAPFGATAISVGYLPIPRVALGVALGYSTEADLWDQGHFRPGAFARLYLLDGPVLRLGVGTSVAHGTYARDDTGSTPDGAHIPISWTFADATRVDGAAVAEVARGDLALRLELGAGRVLGDAWCYAQFPNGVQSTCDGPYADPPVAHGEPPRWTPSAQLALVLRTGDVPRSAASATARRQLRAALTATSARETDFVSDGHYTDAPGFDVGLDGDYLATVGSHLRVGVGGRYAFGVGRDWTYLDTEHVLSLPALAGAFWRGRTGEELEVLVGLGPAAGAFEQRDSTLVAAGLEAEAQLSYVRPLTSTLWLVAGVTLRLQALQMLDGTDYLAHASGVHAEVPVRIGLGWSAP